ncbi:MAG: response regulator transcription factor, partial [Chloroflexi bacterium]|nr:response regulator transcription factor [Chloroflexota bacterium]
MIKLLIVDDHPVVRDGLLAILGTQPDFEVVGEAGNGRQAITLVATLNPDVVLLDLEMPEMDGVETLKRVRATHPEARVIVFTAFDTDERILTAVQAGAQGYLLKGVPRQ